MKFLCVTCDEAMHLEGTRGPDEGSVSVLYTCGGCGWSMAMMTNQWETQVVQSLGVKIGGRSSAPAPMEMLRSNLSGMRPELAHEHGADARTQAAVETLADDAPKCPFSAMLSGGESQAVDKSQAPGVQWTSEAEARIAERIPGFVLPMAKVAIEKFATDNGYAEIDASVLEEAKGIFSM